MTINKGSRFKMSVNLFPKKPVVIVDDEKTALDSLKMVLALNKINNVVCINDSREVLTYLKKEESSVLFLDLLMPDISGEEILSEVSSELPHLPVIIVTGINDVKTAVKCIKNGAFDYIIKPVEEDDMVYSLKKILELRDLRQENFLLKDKLLTSNLACPEVFRKIITQSKKMFGLFQYMEAVAKTAYPILISGETGVGKELTAKALHDLSACKGKFVAVNIAGLDDNMFSDTLFGHLKGAFTGAETNRKGLIEEALDGTLFLDEIGDLNLVSQVKLLRLLQEGEYFPLGSDHRKLAKTRIIVATNQNFRNLEDSGKFRKDLIYRLCNHHINIPPLKERKEDIPLLFDYYLAEVAKELNKKKPQVTEEIYSFISNYSFPGNVRELKSMVLNVMTEYKSGKISLKHFKEDFREQNTLSLVKKESGLDESESEAYYYLKKIPKLKEAEKFLVNEAMKASNKNKTIAAKMLGITRQTLSKYLKE